MGDLNNKGGKISRGAKTVFANGVPVGLHVSPILPHPAGPQHKTAVTVTASPTVFVEGVQVLRVGTVDSCGDTTVQGSPNINVP